MFERPNEVTGATAAGPLGSGFGRIGPAVSLSCSVGRQKAYERIDTSKPIPFRAAGSAPCAYWRFGGGVSLAYEDHGPGMAEGHHRGDDDTRAGSARREGVY